MKTKIKRHSRAVLSIVLTLCMLVSCMTVGIIATDAANVTNSDTIGAKADDEAIGAEADDEAVGTTNYLILSYNTNNITGTSYYVTSTSNTFTITASDFGKTSFETGKNYFVGYSTSSTYTGIYSGETSATTGTTDSGISNLSPQDWSGYKFVCFSVASTSVQSVTVTVSGDAPYTYSMTSSTSGGDSGGGEGGGGSGETGTAVTDNDLIAVLKGTKIMIYFGDRWGSGTKYVKNGISASDNATSGTSEELTIDSKTCHVANGYITVNTDDDKYSISNQETSWEGMSINDSKDMTTAQGGYLYYMHSDNGNTLVPKPSNAAVQWTTRTNTIVEGKNSCSIAATVSGTTGAGRSVSVKYYYTTNGTNFYTFDPSDTSGLTAGTYTIYATAYDTKIHVAAATQGTLTVEEGHPVTFTASPSAGGTISPSGTENVGVTTSTTVTATPNAAYTFDSWEFGDGITHSENTNTATITTKASGAYTVRAIFVKKPTHKVTVVSSNNSYGTATANVTDAYDGQEVTLTATENTGEFGSWTVNSGGVTVSNNKFTMGSSDVSITANFNAYSAPSNFYYNSYGDNGQPAASRYGAQMTEAKLNGETYSYYHVSGRTEDNQLFTVSDESPVYGNYNTYFQIPDDWGGTPKVLFYSTDEQNLGDWVDMNSDGSADGKNKYKYPIPDGARSVRFKHGTYETSELYFTSGYNGWWTDSSMSSLNAFNNADPVEANFYENFNGTNKYTNAFASGGFWSHNANRGESHAYTKPKGLDTTTKGDYYVLVLYKGKTYTINGVTKTISNDPEIIWLPELPDESSDTVKVYAKDGAIRGNGSKTYANIADTTVLKADGTTSAGARNVVASGDMTYEIYKAQKGETITIKTTVGNNDSGALSNASTFRSKYYVRGFVVNGEVPRGTLITTPDTTSGVYTLTYTIPEDFEGDFIEITPVYYLCNTTTYPVVTFRVTDFPKNQYNWGDTPFVYPFYGNLGGYNNSFGQYPGQPLIFYNGQYSIQIPIKSTAWELDTHEGNNKDKTLAQVNDTNVAGVTMNNGYYDDVHKKLMGYGDDSTSSDHVQTYDYGDFWKIFNEKKPVDNIVFDFKYETTKHNLVNDTTGSSINKSTLTDAYDTNGNGFELLKNFHGRNVDLFGTALSGDAADPTQTPAVYVVSIGGINDNVSGVENVAGFYATEWRIYAPNNKTSTSTTYKKMSSGGKSSIPPEILVLNDDDSTSFDATTYPSAVYKEGKYYSVDDWKSLYQALEDYRGLPVYISYEAADAQNGSEDYTTGTHGATRNDGRWLYSKNGETITSNIKIQYSDDNGATYTDLNPTTPQVSGLSASFTNPEAYGETTYTTTIDPDKTYDFEAKTTNANYKFVGWYLDDNNKTLITTDKIGSTERSGSYTFIAKFKLVQSGQVTLSHSVDTGTIGAQTYEGAGSVTIGAVVKDGDGNTKRTYAASTSDITIDNETYINSDSAYTIDVTLTATRGTNSTLGTTVLATPDGQDSKFFDYGTYSTSADGNTRTYTFTVNVSDLFNGSNQIYKNLIYHSYFINYKFNYTVNYEFSDRNNQQKIYNRAGVLNAAQAEAYVFKATDPNTGTERRYLRKEFFESIAPYESNFQKNMTWNISNSAFTDGTNYEYSCNAHFTATNSDAGEKVNVTFVLPYQHTDGVATLNNGRGIAAESTNYDLINDGTNDNRVPFGTIPVLTGNRTNGIYTESDKSHWIAAPTKIYDNSTGQESFFSHWSVKTTDTKVELARCYYPGFNYLAYNNCEITAEYGTSQGNISGSGIYTDVTYLDTTRNQWNCTPPVPSAVAPDVPKTDRTEAADILYNDFVLNYNYNGLNIYEAGTDTNAIQELGIVVERVKELDKNSDGTYDTRISSYTNLAQDTSNVTTAANGANGKTTSGTSTFYKQSINKTALDNKNRILFYEAFYNSAGWDSTNQKPAARYTDKKYVFRAYTYIKYTDENNVTQTVLSETPAYFVMYDIATASYSSN